MRQQQENTRTTHEVSLRQSFRVPDETIQPLKSRFLDPARRTLLYAGYEIDRGANAQRKSAGDAALLEFLRDDFLLRRTNGQKAEPEGTGCLDRAQAGLDRCFVVDKIHGRTDVVQGLESEPHPKLLS